ncbi:MAG: hypothetical protein WD294_02500 [Phycisphaeraceae bacterium]
MALPGSGKSTLFRSLRSAVGATRVPHVAMQMYVSSKQSVRIVDQFLADNGARSKLQKLIGRLPRSLRQATIPWTPLYHAVVHQAFVEFMWSNWRLCGLVGSLREYGFEGQQPVESISGMAAWRSGWIREYTKNFFVRLAAHYQMLSEIQAKNPATWVLLDESFAHYQHYFHRVNEARPTQREIEEYNLLIPLSDIVFFVKAPPEVLYERMVARGDPPNIASDDRETVLERLTWCLEEMEQAAAILRRRGASVIEVDNGGSLERAVATIEDTLFAVMPDKIVRRNL